MIKSEINHKWINKTIKIGGWVRTIRVQGGGAFAFVEINDGSCVKHLQVVVDKSMKNFASLIEQGIGSCLIFYGTIVKSKGSRQNVILY